MFKKAAVLVMFIVCSVMVSVKANAHEECPFKTCDPSFIDRPINGFSEPVLGYNVPIEELMNFICEHYYVVINPNACVDGLRQCIMDRMAQRIYQPNFTEEERAFQALVQCVVGK